MWCLTWSFLFMCKRTEKALEKLRRCADSPEPWLFAWVISVLYSWACSYRQNGKTQAARNIHTFAVCTQYVYLSQCMTKLTKWPVRPAMTQISLRVSPVWSESSLSAWKKAWVLCYPMSWQQRLWSDWADAHADLNLRWVHMSFCWFCHAVAHLWNERPEQIPIEWLLMHNFGPFLLI